MVVFFVKSNDQKGRALMQINRVVPITKIRILNTIT